MTSQPDTVEHVSPDQFGRSVIRSKVQSPPLRTSTLSRPRLLDWLTIHAADRVKVIAAEAGYGKTTLLADYAGRTGIRCLWYRLETSDRDWVTFINYLIAAVRETEPSFGNATAELLDQITTLNPSVEIVVGSFISELEVIGASPTMLILDDFHLIEDATDIYTILGRLFDWAPRSLTFLISSRRSLELPLARLSAAGEVAHLTTDDLRFSREETTELFTVTYANPLEPDLLGVIDTRTEGWGASLQLVYSSIRSRPASETRTFIHSLSGAEGSLYDYLAEEVLGRLPPLLQRILIHASLLDRVVPSLVVAILSERGEPPSGDEVMACIEEADDLGLRGRSSAGSTSRRFHPLLREFLVRQLETSTTSEMRRAMHLRVARVAEATDWSTACGHYIEAAAPTEAMRVLNDSATAALGKGAWGPVTELLSRMQEVEPPPAVQVVRARGLAAAGEAHAALMVLTNLDRAQGSPFDRALIRLTRGSVGYQLGDLEILQSSLTALTRDRETPQRIREIADAWSLLVTAASGTGQIGPVAEVLRALGHRQATEAHHFFAGISLHNSMSYELVTGAYARGIEAGEQALASFAKVPGPVSEQASTLATLASCAWELGLSSLATRSTREVTTLPGAHADSFAECAYIAAVLGEQPRANMMLREARRRFRTMPRDVGTEGIMDMAEAMIALSAGDAPAAARAVADDLPAVGIDADVRVRRLMLRSMIAVVLDDPEAPDIAARALWTCQTKGAHRYELRAELIQAAAVRDADSLEQLIDAAPSSGCLALLEVADPLGSTLALWDPIPAELQSSIERFPSRWLPLLRRQLSKGNTPTAHSAARLLASFGTIADAPRLVAFERTFVRKARARTLGRALVRRASPKLQIRDLGRIQYATADREVALSETRRKAASVLTLLITRPNQMATREQVLDELWPDLDPASATNSLNQTLYFLRRDIDPWYTDGISADYVVNESELVWLDKELVHIDSVEFHRAVTEALAGGREASDGPGLARQYTGRFAPEFEYEEWAIGWRDRVHALYLHLIHATARALGAIGRDSEALDVLLVAVNIDPEALELETQLVQVYSRLGAEGAASRQYRHLAEAYRRELGTDPPALTDLIDPSRGG